MSSKFFYPSRCSLLGHVNVYDVSVKVILTNRLVNVAKYWPAQDDEERAECIFPYTKIYYTYFSSMYILDSIEGNPSMFEHRVPKPVYVHFQSAESIVLRSLPR